ncbi:MAG: prepilin-type N-terminal cleavage/methylation domain-containing protein [Burkholderiales bacterium]
MKAVQKGFTLVEIAIVLVIIGLLLGGILKGQEMITQAKIKNVVADFSGISAAYYGYQDRYRSIPGDDPNAGTRWTGAFPGNGDGVVAGTYNAVCPTAAAATTPESCLWWDDLRRSGFVAGNGPKQPFNAVTGLLGVQTGDGAGGAALGGFGGLIVCSANLPDKIATAVDTQMDDGLPDKGTVRGVLNTAGPNPNIDGSATAATAYAETGTNSYTLCRSL